MASLERQATGQFQRHPAYCDLDHTFFAVDRPDSLWLAGLVAADGCVHKTRRWWSIAQSGDGGRELIEAVRAMIGHAYEVGVDQTARHPSYRIYVPSEEQVADLHQRFGIVPAKSLTLTWPDRLTAESALSFIRGYIDGDGTVGAYRTTHVSQHLRLSYVGTPEFVKRSLEALSSVASGRFYILRKNGMGVASFSGQQAHRLAGALFEDRSLPCSPKVRRWHEWLTTVEGAPPRWMISEHRREALRGQLARGQGMMSACANVGIDFQLGYSWRAKGLL